MPPLFPVRYDSREAIYNPGIVILGNGDIWMYARHEGRNRTSTWSACPDRSPSTLRACPSHFTPQMISFIVRCRLDSLLNPVSPLEALEYDLQWDSLDGKPRHRELGPEDPRLFTVSNRTFIIFNALPTDRTTLEIGRTIRNLKVQQVDPVLGMPLELTLPQQGRVEKNWAPFPVVAEVRPCHEALRMDSGLSAPWYFSRTFEPHEVLCCNPETGSCAVAGTSSQHAFMTAFAQLWELTTMHLGTNLVPIPGRGYLGIMHGIITQPVISGGRRVVGGTVRRYLNFPYIVGVREPWPVTHVAATPLALPLGAAVSGFAFTSNLAWVDSERLVISYNVKDRTASFLVVTLDKLLATLVAVDGGSARG